MPYKKDKPVSPTFVKGVDYYVENGNWVFTESYLRKRGYCCGSGCRHCPFGPLKNPPESSNLSS